MLGDLGSERHTAVVLVVDSHPPHHQKDKTLEGDPDTAPLFNKAKQKCCGEAIPAFDLCEKAGFYALCVRCDVKRAFIPSGSQPVRGHHPAFVDRNPQPFWSGGSAPWCQTAENSP